MSLYAVMILKYMYMCADCRGCGGGGWSIIDACKSVEGRGGGGSVINVCEGVGVF